MSDGVLAAIIAAGATVLASFVQLRLSLAKEFAARGISVPSRRKSKLPFIFLWALLCGALIGGFALAQWLHEGERSARNALESELRERIADLTKAQSAAAQAQAGNTAEVEADVLRRIGAAGVVVLATVAPCKPTTYAPAQAAVIPVAQPPALSAASTVSTPNSACSESDAAPMTLCATVPVAAKITGVELFVRAPDATTAWDSSRATPGQAFEQARFSENVSDSAEGATTRQVCEGFQHWASGPRVARMIVHYSL